MIHALNKIHGTSQQTYVKPAVVTQANGNEFAVRLELNSASFSIKAQNALITSYTPRLGDKVLVCGESLNVCYITGLLSQQTSDKKKKIESASGAKAILNDENEREILAIEDKHGHVIFEYDTATAKSKVYAPTGDLSFNAPNGNVEINSGQQITLRSIGSVTLESLTAAQISVSSPDNKRSSVNITENGILLSSEKLGLNAQKANFNINKAHYNGSLFKASLRNSKLMIGKIETTASRVIGRFKNVYKQVEELHQTRAKRIRTLVDDEYQLRSQNCNINAEKTVKIDGEKIHLG